LADVAALEFRTGPEAHGNGRIAVFRDSVYWTRSLWRSGAVVFSRQRDKRPGIAEVAELADALA